MRAQNRRNIIVRKETCPDCGYEKAGIMLGVKACLHCGHVYSNIQKDV